MWELWIGRALLLVLVLFGVKVISWLYDDDKFTPNSRGRHKTKTSITHRGR